MTKNNHAPFTTLAYAFFRLLDPQIGEYYIKTKTLWNYGFVCGIGVFINMAVIGAFYDMGLGLYVSNGLAILSAFMWNWAFSVGPYGYLFGLSQKTEKEEKQAEEEE